MNGRLGQIEINCDAPPYVMVRASRQAGMEFPEDVRWCRLPRQSSSERHGWWASLRQMLLPAEEHLTSCRLCRKDTPPLVVIDFHVKTGERLTCLMGQCPRCRVIYWRPETTI